MNFDNRLAGIIEIISYQVIFEYYRLSVDSEFLCIYGRFKGDLDRKMQRIMELICKNIQNIQSIVSLVIFCKRNRCLSSVYYFSRKNMNYKMK